MWGTHLGPRVVTRDGSLSAHGIADPLDSRDPSWLAETVFVKLFLFAFGAVRGSFLF